MGFDLPVVLSEASDFKYSVIGSRHTGQCNLGSRQDLAALVSPRGFHSRILTCTDSTTDQVQIRMRNQTLSLSVGNSKAHSSNSRTI